MSTAEALKLYTIPVSHYCEKVRWGLDLNGVQYEEIPSLPIFHRFKARSVGGKPTVPVATSPEGTFNESALILRQFCNGSTPLYPEDEEACARVKELEDYFDRNLGPATRRMAYFAVLPSKQETIKVLTPNAPGFQMFLLKCFFPLARGLMRRALNINQAGYDRSKAKAEEAFNKVEKTLADGRRFLAGDQISAADITFAALAAPILAPPEYFVPLPDAEAWGEQFAADCKVFRESKAGQFALRLFRENRKPA